MPPSPASPPRQVCLLGATGSIGDSTLKVLARHPERFQLYGVSGYRQVEKLAAICQRFLPRLAVVADNHQANLLKTLLAGSGHVPEIAVGVEGLQRLAATPQVDIVVAAIVGAAGLMPTLTAARAGKRILLANKEAMVMAGPLFQQAARENHAAIVPIDSEHNALLQCLPHQGTAQPVDVAQVEKLILTASGGPFRQRDPNSFASITIAEALAHPNWSMGKKISIDSATMVNKGLELIEAHWLFSMPSDSIEVVIHPQSLIHSLVQYRDGSTLAQISSSDMAVPIAHALGFPDRIESGAARLDFWQLKDLTFEAPNHQRFPALSLCRQALENSQVACIYLNAANEVAVAGFLEGRLTFPGITVTLEKALQNLPRQSKAMTLEDILALDQEARYKTRELMQNSPSHRKGSAG